MKKIVITETAILFLEPSYQDTGYIVFWTPIQQLARILRKNKDENVITFEWK